MAETLPAWAREIVLAYESGAASQFVLHGNLHDRFCFERDGETCLGDLREFLLEILLPSFEVVLRFDIGNGVRVERGRETFADWPEAAKAAAWPKGPRGGIEFLTHYFRYCANLAALGQRAPRVACLVEAADLLVPAAGGASHELSALALLLRDWSTDAQLEPMPLATFLLTENLNDLHPLLATNGRAPRLEIPLPDVSMLERALLRWRADYPTALAPYSEKIAALANLLQGVEMLALENRLRRAEQRGVALTETDVSAIRREIVEQECGGLIDFLEPTRTLDDFHGQPLVVRMLREDLSLWAEGETAAMPKGYLFCGPVGTGKTFAVECLAGEASVPVVKLKNFRDRWIGSTEGNLERIFRLLHALGRCFVFVDEADQALGKRDSGSNDSGLSGRVYSMFAMEMSREENRGRIVWVLGTSRPDLIEVDLKRPGRIDVKVPLFPCARAEDAILLLQALCRRRGVNFSEAELAELKPLMPEWLTAGAAETLATKIFRTVRVRKFDSLTAARACLKDYRSPVPEATMRAQIELAVREASDLDFVPAEFRDLSDSP